MCKLPVIHKFHTCNTYVSSTCRNTCVIYMYYMCRTIHRTHILYMYNICTTCVSATHVIT